MAVKKFYPRKKRVYKKRVYKKKVAPKTSVKMMIKRALDRRIENKEVCNTDAYFEFYQNGSGSISPSVINSLNPIIVQSVGENGRVGNAVNLKSAYLKGYLTMAQSAGNSAVPAQVNGQWNVRIFIGRLKTSIASPTSADLTSLLRVGGSTFAFDSTNPLSLVRRVNTELFTIYYDKIHKIGTQTGTGSTTGGIHNNDYQLSKFININLTKYLKKKLIFQDTSINTPTNSGLYIFGGLVDSISSAFTSTTPFVSLTYDLLYSYEDA